MTAEQGPSVVDSWAIVELMGHRRIAGWLTETEIAGGAFLRVDVPSDPPATQLYTPSAVYCITPTTEDTARLVASGVRVAPVERWQLGLPAPPEPGEAEDDAEESPW